MKRILKKLASFGASIFLFIATSVVFLYFLFTFQILNETYCLIVGTVFIAILLLQLLTYKSSVHKKRKQELETGTVTKKTPKRVIVLKIVNILLSITLILGTYLLMKGNTLIENISGSNEDKYIVSIYALADSPFNDLDDLESEITGVSYQFDTETITTAVIYFEEQVNDFGYSQYDDYISLATALYQFDVDTIMIGEEHEQVIEEIYPDFLEETKVVATYEFTKESKITTTPVAVTKEAFNIYITGIDSYGTIETVSRSDVNIIATINPTTKQILLTSIPRDTKITLANNGYMDKLTHAALYGEDVIVETIENLLSLEINYYAKTNFTGIIDIIDALGGVTVTNPYTFTSTDTNGGFYFEEGILDLDGEHALAFLRERYNLTAGDYDRARNQQAVIEALVDKVTSPSVITGFNDLLSVIDDSFETDMSSTEIRALLNMQLSDMSSWEIFSVQVLGDSYKTAETYSMWGHEIYVMEPYEYRLDEICELINMVSEGTIITNEIVEGLQ